MIEQIEWIACADRLPDDYQQVLLFAPADDEDAVRTGYHSDVEWYDVDGRMVLAEVTHWAAWPGGPEARDV